jgi:hypothetical protein
LGYGSTIDEHACVSQSREHHAPPATGWHGWPALVIAAEGLVYVIVGVLAMLAAYDVHKRPTGSHGALETLLSQPFGVVLLGAVAAASPPM